MASKKITLLAVAMLLLQLASYAQTDWGWDWKDSSKVPVKGKPQQNEFLNNQFPYPAKPNSQGEFGVGLGRASVVGDVDGKWGYLLSLSYRKAIGHVVSYRFNYIYSSNSGSRDGSYSSYQRSLGALSYRNVGHTLAGDLVFSFNPQSYYRGNPKFDIYGFTGLSLTASKTKLNGKDAVLSPEGTITRFGDKKWALVNSYLNVGFGAAYKINNKINLALEQRYIFTSYDFLDGFSGGDPGANGYGEGQIVKIASKDGYSFTTLKLNINIGNSATHVQPLWWLNPSNFTYSELNAPKHMKLPKVVLPDADGDGVTDQFDLEPNTPAGVPVDSHGVAKDTDGDGVPDYKDKELLTPQKCFPVNNDGIGTCPEPPCCKELRDLVKNLPAAGSKAFALTDLPSIQFKSSANKLSKADQDLLASVAKQMNEHPDSKIKLIGYGASSKAAQQLSWERVNAIKKYLVEKQGIAENRIIFTYGLNGDANTVDIQGTTEEGPSTVPAPHPNLKSKAPVAKKVTKTKKR